MKNRIVGEKINIDYQRTHAFFENRAEKYKNDFPYVSTMYQDSNPSLTTERDRFEKNLIKPLIGFNADSRVLDIGCGVGRWADEIVDIEIDKYLGIDFSENLIEIAKNRFKAADKLNRIEFRAMAAQEIGKVKSFNDERAFNVFIISGVLIYLNDDDVETCLRGILELADNNSLVYLREPVAIDNRLSLNNFYSEELKTEYNAIYRSIEEYKNIFQKTLLANDFGIIKEDYLFPIDLNNRKETSQYYFLLGRK